MNRSTNTLLTILITALLAGGGVYLWQNQESMNPVIEVPSDKSYTDDYISFEYPAELELVHNQVGEGRLEITLDWLAHATSGDQLETIGMSNPQLRYPYHLEDQDFTTWEELKTAKLALNSDAMNTVTTLTLDGQEAIFIDSAGFCEDHYELYIQGPVDTVYQLTGGCLNIEADWELLYDTFLETVDLKR